jgi:hypothetical protein
MSQSHVKIRLDDRLIRQLKGQAIDLHISFSSLCNQLLGNEVLGGDPNLVGIAAMCIKLDNLMSTLRRIDKKISIPKQKTNDPHQH